MLSAIRKFFRRSSAQQAQPNATAHRALNRILARYDAAQTGDENARHWLGADGLSADAANSPGVRRILRNRCRFEVAHNGYAKRMVRLMADGVIGMGPRLQSLTPDRDFNRFFETEFTAWVNAVGLAPTLHSARIARAVDGESFLILTSNRRLDTAVKLNVRAIEAERVCTPTLLPLEPNQIDGVVLDADGNPTEYHVLRSHPGSLMPGMPTEYDRIDGRFVIHYFRPERPEQHRGICEILTSLPLGNQLRRYTLATLTAAEISALLTTLLKSTATAEDGDVPDPFETLDIERGLMTTLPIGVEPVQLKSDQPTTVYPDFKNEIVGEMGAGFLCPVAVISGNSSRHNFSSARADQNPWFNTIDIDKDFTSRVAMEKILREWMREAATVREGDYPRYAKLLAGPSIPHQWTYRLMRRDIDSTKEEKARDIRLRNGMTSYQSEFAADGLDWETEQEKQAQALGVTVDEYRRILRESLFPPPTAASGSADEPADAEKEEADDA